MELVIPSLDRIPSYVAALKQMLERVRGEGLAYVELTADADNPASHKVIEANGGIGCEHFRKPAAFGGKESVRFRIPFEER